MCVGGGGERGAFKTYLINLGSGNRPGTVACAVILATGTVDIGCL